jgi:hypothetical protein
VQGVLELSVLTEADVAALNSRFALSVLERCSPEWSVPARSLNQNHERSLALRKTLELSLCVLTLMLLASANAAAQSKPADRWRR